MTKKIDDGRILVKRVVAEAGEKDYMGHVKRSSKVEGCALGELILDIAKRDALPEGEPNKTASPVYRKLAGTREEARWLNERGVRI